MNDSVASAIRLRHLHAFIAVCEERHVGRAAVRLTLTQPAVSKTLSELEAIVGHRLLLRGRRGSHPTDRGETFLRHARAVIDALSAAGAALAGSRVGQPVVRLGVLPTVAPALVPGAIGRFRLVHNDVGLVVFTKGNADLLDLVRGGLVDVAIGRMSDPASTSGLTFELLYLEGLALAVRRGHPLAGGTVVDLARVLDFPLVICTAGTVPHRNTEALLGAHGLRVPANCVQTIDVAVASCIVEQSDAVWIAPCGAVQAMGGLEPLRIQGADAAGTTEPVGLFRRIDSVPGAETQALIDCLREAARDRRTTATGQG